ncbi:restriction endonuclease subunit S [Vibrio alginolyticus]|uniref:restriction endonuclease subunit S n=2 Tax=Vibrio TaxID=662 RepID=UPI001BD407D4|nr:restriction endonuclease subunit S [Vibrio alginolyticus]MBS9933200.1 restriction endonuclease subunit S [Vibrio alginolyticus]
MFGNKINNIPDGWKVEHIEDFASIKTGTGDTQDREDGGKYPFFVRSNTIERVNKYTFDGEGVLTSGDGVGVGKIYHYVNGKFHYHQRVYNIHNFKPHVLGRYFYQFFSYRFFQRVSRMSAKGSVDSVRMEMIAKMSVLIPTIQEQQKIAEILSTVDKKIDLIDQKIAETEKLKTSLMQKLFSKGVGVQDENGEWQPHTDYETVEGSKIPKGWLKTTLSQVIKVKSGDSLSKKNMKEGCIPVFGGNGISGYHSKANFNSPQLVIGRVGEYCGAVHITPEKSWITDNALLITETLINVSFEFLYYLLVSVDLNKYASRNAQPLVSGRTLNLVTVKVPQEAEQYEIVNILSTVDRKLILLNRQIEETRRLKKGLMQKLLTGEWRVPVEETEAA